MIALLFIFNLAISFFNCWSVGRSWPETKALGGFPRFMSWMGAIMGAVGFTWCYLVLLAFLAGPDCFNKLPVEYVEKMFSLGYLIIIFPAIGSGLAITLDSWAYFWRRRTLANGAIAGFNTLADVYNIYSAVRYVPSAWGDAKDLFKGGDSDDDDPFALIAILLALAAVFAGILTAAVIIRTVASNAGRNRAFQYAKN